MLGSPRLIIGFVVAVCWTNMVLATPPKSEPPSGQSVRFFEKKIRPMLVLYCYKCHSATSKEIKGGLRLDSREASRRGGDGGPAVVPGDISKSLLIEALRYDKDSLQMPPAGKLPDSVIADFVRWIKNGATDPRIADTSPKAPQTIDLPTARKFWSFQPRAKVTVPDVRDMHWPRNAVDRFIVSRLDSAGLAPANEADRYTLLRRATFDLIGLPPTPAEIAAFRQDTAPSAFERVVDRLLASPHYGERWGQMWLDLARYADSNGADINYAHANAWRYRDYVIRSFNRDTPYDRFVLEQLAGDLLAKPANQQQLHDQLTATGFLVLGAKMLAEVDTDKLLIDIADEQLDVIGQTFLGLTLGCARCHDHKFDPITTRDYYALAGILKSTKTIGRLRVVETKVSEWHEVELPSPVLRTWFEQNQTKIAALEQRVAALNLNSPKQSQPPSVAPLTVGVRDLPVMKSTTWAAWVNIPSKPNLGAAISATHDGAQQGHSLGFHSGTNATQPRIVWNHGTGRHTIIRSTDSVKLGTWNHLGLTYDADSKTLKLYVNGQEQAAAHNVASTPFSSLNLGRREASRDWPLLATIDEFVVFNHALSAVDLRRITNKRPASEWSAGLVLHWKLDDKSGLAATDSSGNGHHGQLQSFRASNAQWTNGVTGGGLEFATEQIAQSEIAHLRRQLKQLKANAPKLGRVMAVEAHKPVDLPVHIRGSHLNLATVPVSRGVPKLFEHCLTSPTVGKTENGRRQLARWITDPNHPLTARVIVNRIWQGHFGRSLVPTPSNFGPRGVRPSHPKLLDWLANEFIRQGWSIKRLHRLIMLSSTYRMGSQFDPRSQRVDPENRLLWRQDLRRLEVESIRDALFAASNQLDRGMGGSLLTTPNYKRVPLDTNADVFQKPRRAIYLPVLRGREYDMFSIFDYPNRSVHTGRRSTTTVAQQALFMLNSPLVARAARALAESVLKPNTSDADRIQHIYLRLYARPATVQEIASVRDELHEFKRAVPDRGTEAERQRDLWTQLCHVLLAANEFVYIK